MFKYNEDKKKDQMLRKYISNYQINLVNAGNIKDLSCFHTDLQVVFGMLKYKNHKKELLQYVHCHEEYFRNIDLETYHALRELLHSEKQLKYIVAEGEEEIDMCQALEELYKDGLEQGAQRVNQLIRILVEKSRFDEIDKMANDREYQKKLFREFEI